MWAGRRREVRCRPLHGPPPVFLVMRIVRAPRDKVSDLWDNGSLLWVSAC
ncbi:hypothetical protein [Streptomyces sp. TLI_105]|nr:hypothetical protein [Streptomyces sp. TLI_105]